MALGPEGARWTEGVPRARVRGPRCGPQRNTTARKRASGHRSLDRGGAESMLRGPEKLRRKVAEPGPNRRDRVRSGLAGDGAGAGGRSLGRRSAEGLLRKPEE
ncbi:hypothetical protein NDU88_007887 [Pleurodeles waltl]|uniref:Uncharacterized protein n=1 Tax=Pleurodeles waltl TaxID=8319 RepID=A0AAV7RTL9_PLEWA|nr:hypothetical protein NDU88_007887 [Pleurodeles waltl]